MAKNLTEIIKMYEKQSNTDFQLTTTMVKS